MARARNIKPGFFSNEELVELPFATRLLFIGLWTLADRMGRMEDRPKRIKMDLFPADNIDVDAALEELQSSGFLLRYVVEGVRYIQVLAFDKHQNPHRDEKASTIPAPCKHGASTVPEPIEHGGNRADSLIPDSLLLIPDSPIPDSPKPEAIEKQPPAAAAAPAARRKTNLADGALEVFEYWQREMNHPTAKLDAKRIKAIKARLTDGYSVADLCQAVDGCKYDPFSQGVNDRQTVFDDIELICRDGPKVDKFRKIAERGPPAGTAQVLSKVGQATARNMEAWLRDKQND